MTDWLKEKEKLCDLIFNQHMSYEGIGRLYDVTGGAIRKYAKMVGIALPKRRKINPSETFNKGRKSQRKCLYCGKVFFKEPSSKRLFCSPSCSGKYVEEQHIKEWKQGKVSGTSCYSCSTFVRNYMLRKHDFKCEKCGWGEKNKFTNKVPLQIHHIDGNSLNNSESNLQVLCPNCHSLTETFGSRNKNAPRGKSAYYGKAKKDD